VKKILILLFVLSFISLSQRVAVSEYQNLSGTPDNEWVELIVLDDDVDLTGFVLRDNTGTDGALSTWSGGVEFRDNRLWRNLRQGTIIVVNNRGTAAVDDDKSDGYIEISAQNTTYFNQVLFGATDWAIGALNIAQPSEIIELRNTSSTEHALAHITGAPRGELLNIPDNRELTANTALSANWSVRVMGSGKAAYTGGFDQNNIKVRPERVNRNTAKGFPNSDINSDYWRELREPTWSAPSLNIGSNGTNLTLAWNNMEADHDNTQGWMVVAYPKIGGFNNNDLPTDGEVYSVNSEISNNSIVLANLASTSRQFVVSTNDLDCDNDYTFRVYAYRFGADNLNKDEPETNARGRSYNQDNYAEKEFIFDRPDKPILSSEGDSKSICDGIPLLLSTEDKGFQVRWYYNGQPINGENSTEILVDKPGTYMMSYIGSNGCEVLSDELSLDLAAIPFARVRYENRIMEDTTFNICEGEIIDLNGVGGEEVFWHKDGSRNGITENDVQIIEAGIYYVEAVNSGICKSYSNTITVNVIEVDLTFSQTNLNFGSTQFASTKTIDITNNSNSSIELNEEDFIISDNFSLQNVQFPLIIGAGQTESIEIVFAPNESRSYTGTITINSSCDYSAEITLTGSKPSSEINLSKTNVTFGTIISCETTENQTFELSRKDNQSITILSAEFDDNSQPFELVSPNLNQPILLDNDDPVEFEIEFTALVDGNYSNTLTIVLSEDGTNPSFEEKVLVSGIFREPKYDIFDLNGNSITQINFGVISGCEGGSIDTSYVIRNTGNIPVDITIPIDPKIVINNAPITQLGVGEFTTVEITFTPQLVVEDYVIDYSAVPCGIPQTLGIYAERTGFFASIEDSDIDLGTIYPCDLGTDKVKFSIPVEFVGESDDEITLDGTPTLEGFDISGDGLTGTFKVGDKAEFVFELIGEPNNGTQEISIKFSPCGEINLTIDVDYQEFEIVSNPATNSQVDFATIDFGDNITQSINIFNPLDTILVINNINGIANPYSIDQSIFPIEIEPQDNIDIDLIYTPEDYDSKDTLDIKLISTVPCSGAVNYTLIGSSNEDDFIAKVYLDIPDDLASNPTLFESFKIPIELRSNEISAENLNLTSLELKITYNGTLFNIVRLEKEETVNQDIEFSNERIELLGESAVATTQNTFYEFGNLFNFIAVSTVGDALQTDIQIEIIDAEYNTGRAELLTEDGKFDVSEYCEGNYRLLQRMHSEINVKDGDIINSNFELRFYGNENFQTRISAFDINGQEIELFNDITQGDIYMQNMNLPNGVYILVYQNGGIFTKNRIMVVD
jgi:hypothetical protein